MRWGRKDAAGASSKSLKSATAKIPVVATYRHGFAFAWRNYQTLLRVFLTAAFLVLAPASAVVIHIFEPLQALFSWTPGTALPQEVLAADASMLLGLFGLFLLASLVFYSLIGGPVMQFALTGVRPPLVPFSRASWMYLSTTVQITLLMSLVTLGLLLLSWIVGLIAGQNPMIALALTGLTFCDYYIGLRLYLYTADSVATGRRRFGHAWALTRGNVMRTIFLVALGLLTYFAVLSVLQTLSLPLILDHLFGGAADTPLPEIAGINLPALPTPLLAALGLFLSALMLGAVVFLLGLFYAMPAFAWRALEASGETDSAPTTA